MATTSQRSAAPAATAGMRWAVTDSLLMARRNLLRMSRRLEYLVFLAIQPVIAGTR